MAPDAAPQTGPSWSVVIPVKVLAHAKSRLTGLPGQRRAEVALAMAADTVAAACAADAVATVIVVTDDPAVASAVTDLGAVVLADSPADGLNEALARGAAYSRSRWPECGCAGLAADLPALRPAELTRALTAAAMLGEAFVPDADLTGTTLYAAVPGAAFRPAFGAASRARHAAAGAAEIELADLDGLRRDVDTVENLRRAAAIGLGPRTRAVLSGGTLLSTGSQQSPHGSGRRAPGPPRAGAGP
jgi:2-phospho-L-lactate/phosphoenolpyruvate guanylyltransferase